MERVEPFIDVFLVVVTNISSIYVICWYLFVFSNQLKMFRFIKVKVDADTKVLEVLGIKMEPMLDLPNARNIPNNMDIEGLYNTLLLIKLRYFPRG